MNCPIHYIKAQYTAFVNNTGLKRSNAYVSLFGKFEEKRPERFDHTLVWRDKHGKIVITTEPYISKENFCRDFFRDWKEKGFDFVEADYGVGLWNPPHCRLFLLTPKKDPANLGEILKVVNALEKSI